MAATTTSNTPDFLHLSRPLPPTSNLPATTAPLSVNLSPTALLAILDHSTRRPPDTERVIGTLLGTRSEDLALITVTAAFAVGHSESQEQVEVDMDYQKQMLQLHLRANPKEGVVGWYATSEELDTFSALIQNFYSGGAGVEGGTYPFPAVHLTMGCQPGKEISIRTYISAPVGVTPERAADSAVFVPVPNITSWGEGERSGLELMAAAQDQPDRTADTVTDIEALERSLEQVLEMLERVSKYVEAVVDEEIDEPSTALGKFLLDTLSLQPVVGMGGDVEKDFNNHIQDTLAISFLANTIRTQIELANRLATATLTLGGGGALGDVVGGGEKANGDAGSKGQRGGRGGRGGG